MTMADQGQIRPWPRVQSACEPAPLQHDWGHGHSWDWASNKAKYLNSTGPFVRKSQLEEFFSDYFATMYVNIS